MKIDTKLGTYDDVFGAVPSDVREIADKLHTLILAFDRDVTIVPRAGEKSVAYGLGPKKMSEAYCYVMPQKGYVNLGFYHGAALPDPKGLLEGTGAKLRHVKVRSLEAAKNSAIMELVKAARAERARALSA